MAKKMLIAAVMVTCYVDGKRVDVQPGQPVPELSEHDEAELRRMGAVVDPTDELQEDEAQRDAADQADADFLQARRNVQAADASLTGGVQQPAQTGDADAPASGAPAAAAAPAKTGKATKADKTAKA